jgi:hypothetical protein
MKSTSTTTRSRTWSAALAGLLSITALVGVSASASAAPAPRAIGLDSGFAVGSNSVMAGASVPYNGDPNSVAVSWGDGSWSAGGTGIPGTGVLLFSHEYVPPANGSVFGAAVTAFSGSESAVRYQLITPRYLVAKSSDYFTTRTLCDSFAETSTEWQVGVELRTGTYDGPLISSQVWNLDRNDGNVDPPAPDFQPLPGSDFSFEMTMADPVIYIHRSAKEMDPIFDDHLMSFGMIAHPSIGSGPIGTLMWQFSGDCEAEIKADLTVTLLKPRFALETLPLPTTPPPTTPPQTDPPAPKCPRVAPNCEEP